MGGRGASSGKGGAAKVKASTATEVQQEVTLDSLREKFAGKTAADVQAEVFRLNKEMGSPGAHEFEAAARFNRAAAPYRQLIQETINNGTGSEYGDYATLLKTSIVKKKR